MARKTLDCREEPNEVGCTLAISGEESELLEAAVQHAVTVHGDTDDEELRSSLRAGLHDAPTGPTRAGAFVQLIDFRTRRIDEFAATVDEWARNNRATDTRGWTVMTADRDQPDTYVTAVEFPDYDTAMANSNNPSTNELAQKLRALCDGDPVYRNLDVRRAETR